MPSTDLAADAQLAANLLAIDSRGLKGAVLLADASESAESFSAALRELLPAGAPWRRIPGNVSDDRLIGGLDVAATLAAGRVIVEQGVLAAAHGGALIFDAARARPATWVHVNRALDDGEIRVERDGIAARHSTAFLAIVADDATDPRVQPSFSDRVAFVVRPSGSKAHADRTPSIPSRADVADARARLESIACAADVIDATARAADRMGIVSVRTIACALACARAHAALHGSPSVGLADLECAARLVLAPRANSGATAEEEAAESPASRDNDGGRDGEGARKEQRDDGSAPADVAGEMADVVVRAATVALERGLLAAAAVRASRDASAPGGAAERRVDGPRGRQIGVRRGDPRSGARVDLVATLRTAAPFQRLRVRERRDGALVVVHRDDLRVRRCVSPARSTTLFVVDASGSAALARLNEAKGAVELLLAEGYARRERVALIAFRGTSAELVLPPTHALARARRAIAGLPAGGGTPLAAGLELATLVADSIARDGSSLSVVVLTDACANVARDGTGGRAHAELDALSAAGRLATCHCRIILIDTARRPVAFARQLHSALGGRYLRLPSANAARVATAVRETA